MEPRSFDRGDNKARLNRKRLFQLQWSRGLLTAETGWPARHPVAKRSWLQWSRGLLTAETSSVAITTIGRPSLQWSRGLLTAETLCCCEP